MPSCRPTSYFRQTAARHTRTHAEIAVPPASYWHAHRASIVCCVVVTIMQLSGQTAAAQSQFDPASGGTRGSIRDIPTAFSGSGSTFNFGLSNVDSGVADATFGGGGPTGILSSGPLDAFGTLGLSNVISGGQQSQFGSGGSPFGSRTGGFGSRSGGFGRTGFNNNNNNQRRNTQESQILYRTRLRVGFAAELDNVSQVTTNLQKRFQKPSQDTTAIAVHAVRDQQSEGATAVLRGSVATGDEALVAEQMALLEPGVARVQNELKVRNAPAAAEKLRSVPGADEF